MQMGVQPKELDSPVLAVAMTMINPQRPMAKVLVTVLRFQCTCCGEWNVGNRFAMSLN